MRPNSKGASSDKLQAKTNRTGSKLPIRAETSKPRASIAAKLPASMTGKPGMKNLTRLKLVAVEYWKFALDESIDNSQCLNPKGGAIAESIEFLNGLKELLGVLKR
jgi:hypothetical protein